MKLTIDITREDYSDFNTFHFLKTRLTRTLLTGLLTLVAVEYLINRNQFDLGLTIFSSIVCIVVYFWAVYRSLKKTKNIPDNDGSILGPKHMEFADDKIYYSTKNSQGNCEWSSIKYLKENSKAFYLYMDANMAILVPKRIFVNSDDLNSFRKIINSKVTRLS